jgi:hypothetical protein
MKTNEARRLRKRYKVDIYWDQYESLRELAAIDRLLERPGGISAMIREAIDSYLSKRLRVRK